MLCYFNRLALILQEHETRIKQVLNSDDKGNFRKTTELLEQFLNLLNLIITDPLIHSPKKLQDPHLINLQVTPFFYT